MGTAPLGAFKPGVSKTISVPRGAWSQPPLHHQLFGTFLVVLLAKPAEHLSVCLCVHPGNGLNSPCPTPRG